LGETTEFVRYEYLNATSLVSMAGSYGDEEKSANRSELRGQSTLGSLYHSD